MSWEKLIKDNYEEYDNKVATYLRIIEGYIPQIDNAYPEKKLNEVIDSLIDMLQNMRRN